MFKLGKQKNKPMRVIGLITSMQEAKELEYVAKVRAVINRIHLLAIIGKARRDVKGRNLRL